MQTRLRVGRSNARHERQAEDIAGRVVRQNASPAQTAILSVTPSSLSADTREAAPPVVDEALAHPGKPIDRRERSFLEPRLGFDLSLVRIHDGPVATQAARAVAARAFTVGRDIVFDRDEYRSGTADGRRLLAHELVHTAQQAGARALQRQPSPAPQGPLTVVDTAAQAEAACDMGELCRLHFSDPAAVSSERVRRAALRCRPGVPFTGSPCLSIAIMNPRLAVPSTPGRKQQVPAGPSPTPEPGAGLPDISRFTKIEFSLGSAAVSVDLPSSAKVKLPVELRDAYKITFEFSAKTSGSFSFSITLDGLPHVQLASTTSLDAGKNSVKSELTVSMTEKTCHAPGPEATKESLKKAGEKLKKAIDDFGKPIDPTADSGFERTMRGADVAGAVADVYKAVEKAKAKCKPTPVFSVGITGQAPLDPRAEGAAPGSITAGITFRF